MSTAEQKRAILAKIETDLVAQLNLPLDEEVEVTLPGKTDTITQAIDEALYMQVTGQSLRDTKTDVAFEGTYNLQMDIVKDPAAPDYQLKNIDTTQAVRIESIDVRYGALAKVASPSQSTPTPTPAETHLP
jgi:hypothetical protein